MDPTNTGLPEGAENPTGASQPQGQPTPPVQQTPADQTTNPAQQPDLAALQSRVQQLEAERHQLDQKARYFQSQYDRVQAAVNPQNQPQVDPVEQMAKQIAQEEGIRLEDAKLLVKSQQRLLQPFMQQLQAQQAAIQNSATVDIAMRNAFSDFAQAQGIQNFLLDPEIYRTVEMQTRQMALQSGQALPVESLKQYALALALQEGGMRQMQRPPGQQPPAQQAPQNIHPLNFNTMTGIPGNFNAQPQRPAQSAPNPAAAELQAELARRMGKQA